MAARYIHLSETKLTIGLVWNWGISTHMLPKLVVFAKVIVGNKLSLWSSDPNPGAFIRPNLLYLEP
jgi:hypothetical protein